MSGLRDALRDLPRPIFGDLLESDEAYLLVLDVPGCTADTTDVRVESGRLVVEARREKAPSGEFEYLTEDRSLFLDAEIPLPSDSTGADAEATVERGVLEIRLPKRGTTPERTIPITDA